MNERVYVKETESKSKSERAQEKGMEENLREWKRDKVMG